MPHHIPQVEFAQDLKEDLDSHQHAKEQKHQKHQAMELPQTEARTRILTSNNINSNGTSKSKSKSLRRYTSLGSNVMVYYNTKNEDECFKDNSRNQKKSNAEKKIIYHHPPG